MGRPSLGAQRREQILEAFERCLVTHGLEATTLEAVAAEAGVQRAAIRHFVGNRDELIAASVDHLTQKYRASYAEELRSLDPTGDRLGAILDYLFLSKKQDIVIIGAGVIGCSIAYHLGRKGSAPRSSSASRSEPGHRGRPGE